MNRVVNPKLKLCRYRDELTLVYAVTVPSYPVLPYMNMHKYPIKIDRADMGTMLDPSTHLPPNMIKCKVKLTTANPDLFKLWTVHISLWSHLGTAPHVQNPLSLDCRRCT